MTARIASLSRLVGCAALAGLAFGAAAAEAATTVRSDIGSPALRADGDAGANMVTASFNAAAGRLVINEPGISTTAPSCVDTGDSISCALPAISPDPRIANLIFSPGSGDDRIALDASLPASFPISIGGGAGADSIFGGPGPEMMGGGEGPDSISGGAGVDSVSYSNQTTPVTAEPNGLPTSGNEQDGAPGARDALAPDVENLIGGNAADILIGNQLGNELSGGKSRDRLIGRAGDDELLGGDLADKLFGGKGNDLLSGERSANDELFGGLGLDVLDARDERMDKLIDCGPGKDRRERAIRDRSDPLPVSC